MNGRSTKVVILDRDGVINEDSPAYIKSLAEWLPIPGSLEAIADLCHAGYRVFVATNQSGLGRGLFTLEALNAMHRTMQDRLMRLGGHVEGVFFCPHRPEAKCDCRKPQPGLLLDISARLGMPLDGIPLVGDAMRDLACARRVGARPVLVRTGKGMTTAAEHASELERVDVYDDLRSFVDEILSGEAASVEFR